MCNGSLFVILLTLFVPKLVHTECDRGDSNLMVEAQLHKEVEFCALESTHRPVKDHKTTVNVEVKLDLRYMTFDPQEEKVTIHSLLGLIWKDEYIKWDPNYFSDIKETNIESQSIWSPRLALFNADASFYQPDQLYTDCLIDNNGTVTCAPQTTHTAICRTALKRWPYDDQNCTLYFGSWMHTGEQVNFTFYRNNPVVLDDFQNAPGWKLLNVFMDRLPGKYSCCPNSTYPMLQYTFVLRRQAAGTAAIIVIPSVVIVLLTLSSLLLDVRDNTRLVMICFSLFGHFTFITEIGYILPKLSADIPVILLFIRDSLIVTLVGIMETLLLMYLRRRAVPAPTWVVSVNRLVSSGPGKYVVFTEFAPCESETRKAVTEDNGGNANDDRSRIHTDWVKFASLVNSCLFIISLLVYSILICLYIPTDY